MDELTWDFLAWLQRFLVVAGLLLVASHVIGRAWRQRKVWRARAARSVPASNLANSITR